jgi:HEAT repeat protein
MAQHLVVKRQPGPDAAAVTRRMVWLCGALGEACASYHRHGRHDVLAAVALTAPVFNTQLMMQLRDHRSATHMAITRMIRGVERPAVAAAMLAFAGVPELSPAVTEGLKLRRSGEHLDPMLSRAHLLANPAVRAAFRKVQQSGHLMPDVALVGRLSVPRLRMLPRWVHHLYARTEAKITAMAPITTSRDRTARLQALRMLIRMEKIQADDLIATMCFDPEASIARIALRHLMARQWEGLADLLVKLISSPHADVAKLAEARFTPMGFNRFWDHYDKLDPAVRRAAGAALIKLDAHFHHQLAARLASDQANDRFKAVMIARELGQESFFEQQLLDLMLDADTRTASSAAAAAGSIGQSAQAVEALAGALEHPDDRVRANAVESIQKIDAVEETYQQLQALLDSAGNRSRANAVKALLQLPIGGALGALGRMLRDPDPEHRISALWVVEQMGLEQVAGRIAELAQGDEDAEVRRRALKVFRQMAQQHEAGASRRQTGA